jgi:uncharacterized protein YbgA (DUF1722 family)/uncharacterized protein YbbK (DUF523 family)
MQEDKIKVGISSCLLGNQVRYNGGHTRDSFITNTLGKYFEFIPICPEVECGLSIPREAMRLIGTPEAPRLVTIKSGIDYTDQMLNWSNGKLRVIKDYDLCGFIFMSKSPSSGMERVKIYSDKGVPSKTGVGLFANEFMKTFPLIPVEENGRLHDPILRENFIERIFVLKRWRSLLNQSVSAKALIDFHTRHKLQILSHSTKIYTELGRLVASIKQMKFEEIIAQYEEQLMQALKLKATTKKNFNVLQHIFGYFKEDLNADEKSEMLEILTQYKEELIPIIVPITLLKHYVRKYNQEYLTDQFFLDPHPIELKLRNHC